MTIHVRDESDYAFLKRALQHQVISEVEGFLSITHEPLSIQAARLIMEFILTPPAGSECVEVNVGFIERLVHMMILFVSALIRERVGKDAHRSIAEKKEGSTELSECDSFLRVLRCLQGDLENRAQIDDGTYEPELPVLCIDEVHVSRYGPDAPIEHVIEQCLVKGIPCLAYHWISLHAPSPSIGGYMRSIARLIAYQFLSSTQLDAFYIGVHVLRNAGEDVNSVLCAICMHTSIKFVRDRIFSYLPDPPHVRCVLHDIEKVYSNNCYDTQLNRQWTRALDGGVRSTCSSSSTSSVVCGNIRDTSATKLFETSGKIGSISTEDSRLIDRLPLSTCCEQPLYWGGRYLHMTLAWVEAMSEREISWILLEGDNCEGSLVERIEYHRSRKNFRTVLGLVAQNNLKNWELLGTQRIEQAYREAYWKRCPVKLESLPRDIPVHRWLARVNALMSENAEKFVHAEILSFLADKPPVFQLYLARFGLGTTPSGAASLLELCGTADWGVEVLLLGRLGNSFLCQVSKLMRPMAKDPELVARAEGMFEEEQENVLPAKRICEDAICKTHECRTYFGDVSVSELLEDVLGPRCRREKEQNPTNTVVQLVDEIEYLIAQGRPAMAYATAEAVEDAPSLARRVAFYNVFQDSVVAAAVSFLELLGEPTETLRVDIQAARMILGTQNENVVSKLFLSFEVNNNLLGALKLLEEAAWAQESPDGTSGGGFESPWHLVALFCRVHNLPRSLTLLHELARNGDWVMFLHESDLQQCPLDTVRDVVQFYFAETPLRSHLNILVNSETGHARAQRGVRCPGLTCVLTNDAKKWLETMEDNNAQERMEKIFYGKPNKAVVFQRYFEQYRFEEAKALFEEITDIQEKETAMKFAACQIGRSELLQKEMNEITNDIHLQTASLISEDSVMESLRSNLTASSPSMVPSIVTDDDDEEVDMELVAARIAAGEFGSIEGFVTSDHHVLTVAALLMQHSFADAEAYLAAVCVVDIDHRELLGDALMAHEPCSSQKYNLAYMAYSSAFIEEAKFDIFIDQIKRQEPLLGLVDIPELRRDVSANPAIDRLVAFSENPLLPPNELVLVADELDRATRLRQHTDREAQVLALGAAIRVSELYRDLGLRQKHLAANQFGASLVDMLI